MSIGRLSSPLHKPTLTRYEAAVLADSPLLYWRLGTAAGLTDRSPNSRNGTAIGSPTIGGATGALAGDIDKATALNGTSQYIDSTYAWVKEANYTLECWAYRTDTTGNHALFGGSGATPPFLWLASGGENVVFQAKNGAGSATTWTAAFPGVAQWVHVVLAFANSENKASLYLNGAIVETAKEHKNDFEGAGNFEVGNLAAASKLAPFKGSLDEVALYSGLLSEARIKAHYEAGV